MCSTFLSPSIAKKGPLLSSLHQKSPCSHRLVIKHTDRHRAEGLSASLSVLVAFFSRSETHNGASHKSHLSGMNPVSVRLWLSVWWDTNRPPCLTSCDTAAYGECTLEFSPQSKHIGGLFLTPVLVIDALRPVLFYVSCIPPYQTKELIGGSLEARVTHRGFLTLCCNYRPGLSVHH